jgi:hypothetical protein
MVTCQEGSSKPIGNYLGNWLSMVQYLPYDPERHRDEIVHLSYSNDDSVADQYWVTFRIKYEIDK